MDLRWITLLSASLVAAGNLARAAEPAHEKLYYDSDFAKSAQVMRLEGVRISDTAACRSGNCNAARVAREKSLLKLPLFRGDSRGTNPTSPACRKLGGLPDIFYRQNRNQISVCLFPDNSFMVSWDWLKKSMEAQGFGFPKPVSHQ